MTRGLERFVGRRVAIVAAGVGLAGVALVALLAVGDQSDPLATDTNRIVGQPAPKIRATDSEGRPFDLDDYRGRWVLLNFFATWCVPCIQEHPELVAFDEAGRKEGNAAVVSVAYNDTAEAVQEFFDTRGGDWAVIADEGDVSLDYAVVGLPESYLISPDGVVVEKFIGGVTRADIERRIAEQ